MLCSGLYTTSASNCLGVVGRAVVVDPGPADRELVEPEHVHHARPPAGLAPKRFGPLGQAGADQQAAVRAARDRQLRGSTCTRARSAIPPRR